MDSMRERGKRGSRGRLSFQTSVLLNTGPASKTGHNTTVRRRGILRLLTAVATQHPAFGCAHGKHVDLCCLRPPATVLSAS